jgi:hypothetical protein
MQRQRKTVNLSDHKPSPASQGPTEAESTVVQGDKSTLPTYLLLQFHPLALSQQASIVVEPNTASCTHTTAHHSTTGEGGGGGAGTAQVQGGGGHRQQHIMMVCLVSSLGGCAWSFRRWVLSAAVFDTHTDYRSCWGRECWHCHHVRNIECTDMGAAAALIRSGRLLCRTQQVSLLCLLWQGGAECACVGYCPPAHIGCQAEP